MSTPLEPQGEPRRALLPMFAPPPAQHLDPPLSPVDRSSAAATQTSTTTETATEPAIGVSDPSGPTDPSGPATPTRTSSAGRGPRWKPGGDPEQVAEVLVGLLVLGTASLGMWLARRNRHLRQPTPEQATDICEPLARIACRHLPMSAVTGDLVDVTKAAGATHAYVLDGPLIVRTAQPIEPQE